MKRLQLENRTDLKSEIPLRTPYCLFVDPSSVCNFKCVFCMNQKIKRPEIMEFSLFKKIIDDLEEFEDPIKTIRLYGFGEPFLNSSFCNMVYYAKKSRKVLNVDTTTNASLLNHELSKTLVESGIDRINISIEAMSTEKYREFTRNKKVVYEEIVEAISELYQIKSKTVIFVKINGDYLNDNEKQKFTDTFTSISDGCSIEHTMNCWRDFEFKETNKDVGIYGQPLKEVITCPYVFYSFLIHPDGYASSCFLDWNKKLVIGDVKNESVKSLWNDKIFNYLRLQMLHRERKSHPVCKSCNQLIAGMPTNLDNYVDEILKKY